MFIIISYQSEIGLAQEDWALDLIGNLFFFFSGLAI